MTESNYLQSRFLKNFFSLSAAEVVSRGLSFAATVHIARVLGAEGFGVIGFCTALLFYFLLIVSGGLDLFGIREITRHREELKRYVENIVTMRMALSLAAGALLLAASTVINGNPTVKTVLRLYGLTLFSFALSLSWAFQSVQRVGVVALGNICTQMIFAGAVFISVRSPSDIWRVPLAQFAAEIGAALMVGAAFFRSYGPIRWRLDFELWKSIFLQTLPIGLSLAMSVIMLNLDAVILGFLKGPTVVGWYSAAYRIVLLLLGFSTLYHITILPAIAQHPRDQVDDIRALVTRSLRQTAIVAVPLGVGGTILAQPLISWIYGAQYENGAPALQIIIWSVALTVIRLHYRNVLLVFDEQKSHMRLIMWGAALNTVLNFALIPWLSLLGAAIATVCAEALVLWRAYFDVKHKIAAIPFLPALLKPGLAAAVMALGLAALPASWSLFLQMGTGVAVYFCFLFLIDGISLKDMQNLYKYVQTR